MLNDNFRQFVLGRLTNRLLRRWDREHRPGTTENVERVDSGSKYTMTNTGTGTAPIFPSVTISSANSERARRSIAERDTETSITNTCVPEIDGCESLEIRSETAEYALARAEGLGKDFEKQDSSTTPMLPSITASSETSERARHTIADMNAIFSAPVPAIDECVILERASETEEYEALARAEGFGKDFAQKSSTTNSSGE